MAAERMLRLHWQFGDDERGSRDQPSLEDVMRTVSGLPTRSWARVSLALSELINPAKPPPSGVTIVRHHGETTQWVEWRRLTVKAKDGEYILDLLDHETDEVRRPIDGIQRSGAAFGSIEYEVGVITQDDDLVRRCFEEFATTGDVSRRLLD